MDSTRLSVDTADVRRLSKRGQTVLIGVVGAVVFGAAGWLIGWVWFAVGLVLGPFIAMVAVATWMAHTRPDPADLLGKAPPDEVLAKIQAEFPTVLLMARTRQGKGYVAERLWVLSLALEDCGYQAEPIQVAEEAIDIYRALEAAKPGKHAARLAIMLNRLAELLAAAGEPEQAMAVMDEAVEVRRNLASAKSMLP
jgi:hypothetical protein